MSSPFTLTIDWLAFTLPAGAARDTMEMVGDDWTKSDTGFRGYPASWITASASRGVGKLGTGAPRAPLEVHVDLSAGIVAPWPTNKVRTVLQWIMKQDGHLTRLDCPLDDRASCVALSTIKHAIQAGQCVTRADRIVLDATDEQGKPFTLEAEGLVARCIQHEIDHLDGILFVDHLSPLKRQLLLSRYKKDHRGEDVIKPVKPDSNGR